MCEVGKCLLTKGEQDAPWQVKADGKNEFVFNTECHPIRVQGRGGWGRESGIGKGKYISTV